ncbi:MAG: hypothetical protein AB7F43_10675 [Bacteriovoracia bacterium]
MKKPSKLRVTRFLFLGAILTNFVFAAEAQAQAITEHAQVTDAIIEIQTKLAKKPIKTIGEEKTDKIDPEALQGQQLVEKRIIDSIDKIPFFGNSAARLGSGF